MFTKVIIVNIGSSIANAAISGNFTPLQGAFLFAIIPIYVAIRNYNMHESLYLAVLPKCGTFHVRPSVFSTKKYPVL